MPTHPAHHQHRLGQRLSHKKVPLIASALLYLGSPQSYPSMLHRWPWSVLTMPNHAPWALISPDHAQPCPMGPPHCIPYWGLDPGQNTLPQPQGLRHLLRSHGHHVMITQPCTTQATSLSDLGPECSNPLSFPSIFILHANASLIAPEWFCMYLLSFLTWRLTVCSLVSCSHPHLLLSHADIHCSYRYPPASILIAYISLWPCGPVSISSPLISLYLVSLIIISLCPSWTSPWGPCTFILLTLWGLWHWDTYMRVDSFPVNQHVH